MTTSTRKCALLWAVVCGLVLALAPSLFAAAGRIVLPNLPAAAAGDTPMMRCLGVNTHLARGANWNVAGVLPLMQKMGVSVIRDGIGWSSVERSKGVYSIPANDRRWLDAMAKANIRVFLILSGKNAIYPNQMDPDAFARYCAYMAKTLKGNLICTYEIWNEPPNFDFKQYFPNTPWIPKYGEIARKAAAAIRQVDEQTPILESLEGNEWIEAMKTNPQDYAQVDGIDMHPYPKRNPPEPLAVGNMASGLPKQYLGRELQLWIGEYGFPTMTQKDPHWGGVTDEEQAAFQVRGLLLGLKVQVKAWCIYDFVNEGTSPTDNEDNMGLIRDITHNHEPKPAFYSLMRVARLMGPDWQLVPEAEQGKLEGVDHTANTAWFRVGGAYLAYVWKGGVYSKDPPTLGKILWNAAAAATVAEAVDLVTGQVVPVQLTRDAGTLTVTDVPVGSNPVAVRLRVGSAPAKSPR